MSGQNSELPETKVNIRTVGARKPPMMAGLQAEENLTGRVKKNVRKILDVIIFGIIRNFLRLA